MYDGNYYCGLDGGECFDADSGCDAATDFLDGVGNGIDYDDFVREEHT
jgi:hypothetical protein